MAYRAIIILHIYYERMWTQVAKCVDCILHECRCDIIVTIPDKIEGDATLVRRSILNRFPAAKIIHVENRGFDVGPFFEVVNGINLDDYDFLIKLHTKRDIHGIANGWVNGFHLSGTKWRDMLLGFCSSRQAVHASVMRLTSDEKVGLVSCSEVIVPSCDYYERLYPEATSRALSIAKVGNGSFVAGTMFMIRANLLKPLQKIWSINDFSMSSHGDNRNEDKKDLLPYVLERLIGYTVCSQGFRLVDFRGYRPFFKWISFSARMIAQLLRLMRRIGTLQ